MYSLKCKVFRVSFMFFLAVLLFVSLGLSAVSAQQLNVEAEIGKIFLPYSPTTVKASITALGGDDVSSARISWWSSYPVQLVFSNAAGLDFSRPRLNRDGTPSGGTQTMTPTSIAGTATGLDVDFPSMPGSSKDDMVAWQPNFGAGDGQVNLDFHLTATTANDGGTYTNTVTYTFLDVDYP